MDLNSIGFWLNIDLEMLVVLDIKMRAQFSKALAVVLSKVWELHLGAKRQDSYF